MSESSFKVLDNQDETKNYGSPVAEAKKTDDLNERIKTLIGSADVLLFMKGTPDYPQCGFSANTVGMLNSLKVPFKTFDILSDISIREGVKAYSEWPTYPQLYYKGKLLGGNDILTEMYGNGELQKLLQS